MPLLEALDAGAERRTSIRSPLLSILDRCLEPSRRPRPVDRESARKALYQRLTKDVEVSSKWPLGFETGTWEGHLGTIAGPTVIGGRYSAQWVKRGDRWLIRSELFVALTCRGVGCKAAAVP